MKKSVALEAAGFSGFSSMVEKFVGFYWTLPVSWAGPWALENKTADEAAAMSKTIRYQLELTRRLVKAEKGQLVGELVALDVEPDRGTDAIADKLNSAIALCREANATLIYTDFSTADGWRRHMIMRAHILASGVPALGLEADVYTIGDFHFDPGNHFKKWQERHNRQAARLRQNALIGLSAAATRHPEPVRGRYRIIAQALNNEGIRTVRGKSWTANRSAKH